MTRFRRLRQKLEVELAPYPGRIEGTLQDALSMVFALVFAETLRVSGIALALALILLMQRESPGITLRASMQIFGGAAVGCIVCLFWVQFTDSTEVFRFLGLVFGVFFAGFCMASTRIPLFFTMFGFYGFVDLSGWDTHHSANAIVTTMLYNMAALGIALGSAVAVNYIFSSLHPGEELHKEFEQRLRLLSSFYRELADAGQRTSITDLHHQILQLGNAGDIKLNQLYEKLRSSEGDAVRPGIRFRIGLLTRVFERSILVGFSTSSNPDDYRSIAELCDHILNPSLPKPQELGEQSPAALRSIYAELALFDRADEQEPVAEPETTVQTHSLRLFHSDAFTKPDAAIYALKLTLCATVCYLIYNAIAWPGILTCVATVLFTGLSTTGSMKQKQLFRLSGAAIGGALAILVQSLFSPNMDSITALAIVAGLVCVLSAWISRSPRIGYVGVQIAFAFFLTDIAGFSAATQIAPARDRVFGIALGILVMWFVFDQVWPTRPSHALAVIRDRMMHNANRLSTKVSDQAVAAMREEVSTDLAQMQILLNSAWFDFSADQHRELARSRRITRQIEAAASMFYSRLHADL